MITNVKAVTVFNGRLDKAARRKIFTPTVIKDVFYAEGKGTSVTGKGIWGADTQYKLRIPLTAMVQDGRLYMPDLDYAKLGDEETGKYWTIQKGDLAIKGEYAGESPALYEDEVAAYAKERGLGLIHITEYADNTSGGSPYLKHWRIGGK